VGILPYANGCSYGQRQEQQVSEIPVAMQDSERLLRRSEAAIRRSRYQPLPIQNKQQKKSVGCAARIAENTVEATLERLRAKQVAGGGNSIVVLVCNQGIQTVAQLLVSSK
jgi:hypothetical protein